MGVYAVKIRASQIVILEVDGVHIRGWCLWLREGEVVKLRPVRQKSRLKRR